jgi:hypothetical protein
MVGVPVSSRGRQALAGKRGHNVAVPTARRTAPQPEHVVVVSGGPGYC